MSLLPDTPPQFSDFQVAAVTQPAQSVGGDIYDFHALSPRVLAQDDATVLVVRRPAQ